MKLLRKQMLLCSILFLVFTLSACSAIGQTDENNLTDSATSAEKTVSVVRGTITPKLSWEIRLDLQSVFRQIMPIKNGT